MIDDLKLQLEVLFEKLKNAPIENFEEKFKQASKEEQEQYLVIKKNIDEYNKKKDYKGLMKYLNHVKSTL